MFGLLEGQRLLDHVEALASTAALVVGLGARLRAGLGTGLGTRMRVRRMGLLLADQTDSSDASPEGTFSGNYADVVRARPELKDTSAPAMLGIVEGAFNVRGGGVTLVVL